MAASGVREGESVIVAKFEVKPGELERFSSRQGRRRSVGRQGAWLPAVDVTVDRAAARVLLYEVTDDEAALDAHLETPHLAAFRAGIESLVVSRIVRRLSACMAEEGRTAKALWRSCGCTSDLPALGRLTAAGFQPWTIPWPDARRGGAGRTAARLLCDHRGRRALATSGCSRPCRCSRSWRAWGSATTRSTLPLRAVMAWSWRWSSARTTTPSPTRLHHDGGAQHRLFAYTGRSWRAAGAASSSRVFRTTVGILGLGRIGRALARRCRGFETRLLPTTRSPIGPMPRPRGSSWCCSRPVPRGGLRLGARAGHRRDRQDVNRAYLR